MKNTVVERFVEDPRHMRLYQQERAIYEVTDLIESLMEELGVSRAELARRLGKSRAWVTQLLDGEANKTIRTVADVFAALGREYHSSCKTIQISNKSTSVVSTEKGATNGHSRGYGHVSLLVSFRTLSYVNTTPTRPEQVEADAQ
jgi:transcriptional regulator with XRE-family HTH domain